jgi:hypothetical protein
VRQSSLHPPNDLISKLRLPLWTSIGKAEPSPRCSGTPTPVTIGASRAGRSAGDLGDCLAFGKIQTGGGSLSLALDSSKRFPYLQQVLLALTITEC